MNGRNARLPARRAEKMETKKTGIIYMARNKVNGKCYIGLTTHTLDWRRRAHEKKVKKLRDHFHCALRLHGVENFEWSVLRHGVPFEVLKSAEIKAIARYKPQYNSTAGGDGLVNPSRRVRARLSVALKKACASPEYRARQSVVQKKARASPEARVRMSTAPKKGWARRKARLST